MCTLVSLVDSGGGFYIAILGLNAVLNVDVLMRSEWLV